MVTPTPPRAVAARSKVIEIEPLPVLAGIIQKWGRRPLLVVAGGVSKEGDTIESVPLFCAPLVTFPAGGK